MAKPTTGRAGGAPSLERCTRCGIRLLSNEHTRDRGVCHSCWASEMAEQAAGQEAVPEELAPWLDAVTEVAVSRLRKQKG